MDTTLTAMDAIKSSLEPEPQESQVSAMENPIIAQVNDAITILSRKFNLNDTEESIFQQAGRRDLSTIGAINFEWSLTPVSDVLQCLDTELLDDFNVKDVRLLASICATDLTAFDFEGLWQEIEARTPAQLQVFLGKCVEMTTVGLHGSVSLLCRAFIGATTYVPTSVRTTSTGDSQISTEAQENGAQVSDISWCQDIADVLLMTMLEYTRVVEHHSLSQLELAERCFLLLCRQVHLMETGQGFEECKSYNDPEGSSIEDSMSEDDEVTEVSIQNDLHAVQNLGELLSPQASQLQQANNSEQERIIDKYEDIWFQQQDLREDADDAMDEDAEKVQDTARLTSVTLQEEAVEDAVEENIVVKRKRGRPSKKVMPEVCDDRDPNSTPLETGHGKKSVLETAPSNRTRRASLPNILGPNNANNKVTKRGPGRPRKTETPQSAPARRASGRITRSTPLTPSVRQRSGRGRPIRVDHPDRSVTRSSPASEAANIEAAILPAKRGPGRPRKHPLIENSPVVAITPKRGPGRPRKHPLATSKSPVVIVTPKRGPGRPRKHPIEESAAPVAALTSRRSSERLRKEVVVVSPVPKRRGRSRPRKTI